MHDEHYYEINSEAHTCTLKVILFHDLKILNISLNTASYNYEGGIFLEAILKSRWLLMA